MKQNQPEGVGDCSKCSGDLDTTGYPRWCKSCRAEWKREYLQVKAKMEREAAFFRGVDSDRTMLAVEFARLGNAMLSGTEIAHAISFAPRPNYKPPALEESD